MIYADYNATAPLLSEIRDFLIQSDIWGNASSVHAQGRRLRNALENARDYTASLLNIKSNRVCFVSGATESNNTILRGFQGRVIVSAIEHDSVLKAREDLLVCPVTSEGFVNLEVLEDLIKSNVDAPLLISIMAANNETGIIQPLEKVKNLCRQYGAYFHCDSVQALGRMPLDFEGIHFASLSLHKFGGLPGVGIMIVDPKVPLKPLLRGGGQEKFYRPGTENWLGILSVPPALELALAEDWENTEQLRNNFEKKISAMGAKIIGQGVMRLPNTTCVAMPGVTQENQVMAFDLEGIAISAGSACSSGKVRPSHVLKAMGFVESESKTFVRFSFGPHLTELESEKVAQVWHAIFERVHQNKYESTKPLRKITL
jgi:cysteine desulfurase